MEIVIGIVCFVLGYFVASFTKDNINIGFGNQNITMVDGKIVDKKTNNKLK